MLQDTVLVGGFAFLATGGIIWVLLNKVNQANWPDGKKRLATYALLAVLIAVAIFVIDWHSSNYKENYEAFAPVAPSQMVQPHLQSASI